MYIEFGYPKTQNKMIEDLFETDYFPGYSKYPAVDITEHENEMVVLAELPGVRKEDVKITFEDNTLTLSGERKPYEIPENARVLLNEVRVRNFNRSIEFPNEVNADKITAEMQNGVLRIVLPKSETAKPRTIELK
jgi:HSP20 family protein